MQPVSTVVLAELCALLSPLLAIWISLLPREENARIRILLAGQFAAFIAACFGAFSYMQGTDGLHNLPLPMWTDLRADFVSSAGLCAITFISTIVLAFSERYMLGDDTRMAFLQHLALLASTAGLLVASENIVLSLLCWNAISLILWRCIALRREAQASARLVLWHHLFADALMLVAVSVLVILAQSANLETMVHSPTVMGARLPLGSFLPAIKATDFVSLLLIVSLSVKSALFPFHRWLTATLDAPTPLSGLLHAGVVNISAIMAARLFPILTQSVPVLMLWAFMAAASAVIGTLIMSTQYDVKRKLVYSTVGQMGFMCLQCALGALPAALLHMVAHGLFKCHMFLQSGSAIAEGTLKNKWGGKQAAPRDAGAIAAQVAVVLSGVAAALWLFSEGTSTAQSGAIALLAALAIIPTLPSLRRSGFTLTMAAGAVLIAVFTVTDTWSAHIERMVAIESPIPQWILPLSLACFLVANFVLRYSPRNSMFKALWVHALSGFYIDELVEALKAKRDRSSNTNTMLEAQ